MEGGKASCPHLKEHEIEKLFHHHPSFESFLPSPLCAHLNTLFNLLSQLFGFVSNPDPNVSADDLGDKLLAHLTLPIHQFCPIFEQNQITPYLHLLCAHIQRTTDVHGGLGGVSTSVVESVNFRHTKKLINHTSKGGGKTKQHFWFDVVLDEKMLVLLRNESLFEEHTKKNPFKYQG